MPFITSVHESLPYIDPEPTPEQRAAAEALVAEERARVPDDPHHALLPPAHELRLTPALRAEVDRVAASNSSQNGKKTPLAAIDLSRYEAQDGVSADASHADRAAALARAYTSQAYLRGRRTHLALLDSYGKNAWLLGNWQAEAELRAVEAELAQTRRAIDLVTLRRQQVQNDAAAELQGLDRDWKAGVGRVLETEAAAEMVRRQMLEARRLKAEEEE